MTETGRLEEALQARLSQDTTLATMVSGVFASPAPAREKGVLVVHEVAGEASDVVSLGGARIVVEASASVYVRVDMSAESKADTKRIVDWIDTLLHNWRFEGADGTGYIVLRDSDYRDVQAGQAGTLFALLGGNYRVVITPA